MQTLAGIDDEDLEVGILVQDLLYSSIVATLPGQLSRLLLSAVLGFVIVAQISIPRGRIELARLKARRRGGLFADCNAD